MLTIPIERITLILDRASAVEPADVILSEAQAEAETEDTGDDGEEAEFATPAQQSLIEVLETLTQDELYELLALAEMAGFDGGPPSWQSALARAQATAADNAVEHLVRILVLSDAVEVGLDRLGYGAAAEPKRRPAQRAQAAKTVKAAAPARAKPRPQSKAKARPRTRTTTKARSAARRKRRR
jgi:Protein of unknown function (DUF3775)